MRFLKGNVLFFALLLLVMMLFTYYALKEMKIVGVNQASCKVTFSESYTGGECKVFIDDSLLHAGQPLVPGKMLVMERYAMAKSEESLYTSASLLKVVANGDTVVRTLGGDRLFSIGSRDGKIVVDAIE